MRDQPDHKEKTSLLDAWTVLEALSPRTFRQREDLVDGDSGCVAALSEDGVPWWPAERPRRDHRLYYQVVLGEIRMDLAMAELIRAFGDDEELSRREREKAVIASVLLDAQGNVLADGIAVSSFAWAFPIVQALRLQEVGEWSSVEQRLVDELRRLVARVDDEGQSVPLDFATLQQAREWLIRELRLPEQLVEAQPFALRVHHHVKAKKPPDPLLLNSFYLEDLARVSKLIRDNRGGAGLYRYLGQPRPGETIDLLADQPALERLVAPAMFPLARWPIPGGHPLVLLQQAAVNAARTELAGSKGIIAVNGPPGTGKSTLLRELIAQCVVDRALAMASFDEPERAFTPSGTTVPVSDKAYINLYRLDDSLKGHEIVIASTNNRAVENVSKEVPAAQEVSCPEGLRYFKSISDAVFDELARDGGEEQPEPVDTWGLIAAVLGKSANRSAFQRAFWWDDDRSMRVYLKAAKGESVLREIRDATGKLIERREPQVVADEQPPRGSVEAKANWMAARARLRAIKQDIDIEVAKLERVRQVCLQIAEKRAVIARQEAERASLSQKIQDAKAAIQSSETDCDSSVQALRVCRESVKSHKRSGPGWLARLFRTHRWKQWATEAAPLDAALEAARERVAEEKTALLRARKALEELSRQRVVLEYRPLPSRSEIEKLERSIEPMRAVLGDRMLDADFWTREHASLNLSSAWMPESLQRKREDLFAAAMAVHKAFIDAAAARVLHNLSIFMNVLGAGTVPDEKRPELLTDLWSTFFAVVPVISTTFASVPRMFGQLPPEGFGWLFIDEAGQALPQAAAGAIMRAKRTVVVGDPLQIPPVISLPERLVQEICEHFHVDHKQWSAPKSSAQTLADRASRFQSAFQEDQGPRRVGLPLLVHRRCQDPMFSISNTIAYNGLMVQKVGPRAPGAVGRVLGEPQWFDLDGEANSKWCPDEGEFVVELLRSLADADVTKPDVFIISPFRIVADSMYRRLEAERHLFARFDVSMNDWLSQRVGTIHTFQGGEANTVILLLGAPNAAQNRARDWAAGTPNILNVAVSRAKQNLYVVGSRAAWSGVGHCREIARRLDVTRVQVEG